jgi:hypothetical protein
MLEHSELKKVTEWPNHPSGRDKKWKQAILHTKVGIACCTFLAAIVAVYMAGIKPDGATNEMEDI